MPWKAFKVESEFCVFKLDGEGDRTGKSLGCHDSRKKANRQVAALNVQENKNMDDVKDVTEDKEMHVDYHGEVYDTDEFVPFGVTTFDEYDAGVEAQKRSTEVKKDTKVLKDLVDNILRSDEIINVKTSIVNVAKEFGTRVSKNLNLKQRTKKNGDVKEMSQFMVFKDTEKDRYGFFTTYSNNIRDDDNPPEIIAAESHVRFEEMVDKGKAPLPQLWLWHLSSAHMGETEVIAYDKDTGVSVAAGYFFKEAEPIARIIEANPELWGVSHGMARSSVVRSEEDPTVIIQHVTKEISPTPNPFPANRWADFSIHKDFGLKELSMAIPKDKQKKLKELGVTDEMLEDLDASSKSLAEQVEELGLERKESDPPAEETETPAEAPVEVEPTAEPEAEPAEEPVIEEELTEEVPAVEEDATAEDAPVAPFTDNQVTELKNTFQAFGKILLKEVGGMLQPITDALTEQKKTSEDTLKETLESTPLASLQDLILGPMLQDQSATQSDQTIVDGRTKEARDGGPEITEEKTQHINSGHPILDMVLGDIIQDSLEPAKPAA